MLESFTENVELKFKELSPEEKQRRGILGRLYGPIADVIKPTRNERRYTESLWEKVFDNPLTKEMFAQGGVPGELDHPTDRDETNSEKIAIMMPEPPTKGPDGKLVGYFDIIDTPCGRIAYALAKYGFNLGISSRGSGDTYFDGNEEIVDEDTYSFNAFDLVLLPACKDARLQLAESLDTNKINFKKALRESLERASVEDRKIMTETLDNLDIDYSDSSDETKTEETEKVEEGVADDDGTNLVNELQEALKENHSLQRQVVTLHEKLSVSYTKESRLQEENTKLKDAVKRLSESVSKAQALSNQLKSMKEQLESVSNLADERKGIIESYQTKFQAARKSRLGLKESVSQRDTRILELQAENKKLNESVQRARNSAQAEVKALKEELESLKTDSQIKNSQYAQKLSRSNELVESYRKQAAEAVDRYIHSKALNLGITANEIKNRLSEGYSFDDIDSVCEGLRSYKRNMNKLPFELGNANISRVTLKEDTSTQRFTNPDDVVDSSLFNLIN